jgi:hypothetical protein
MIALVTAHLLGDFVLRSNWTARSGRQFWRATGHALTQGALAGAAIGMFAEARFVVLAAAAIFIAHAIIDLPLKRLLIRPNMRQDPERWRRKLTAFVLEQLLHLVAIVAVVIGIGRWRFEGLPAWAPPVEPGACATWLVYTAGLVTAVWMGGTVIGIRVEPFLAQLNPQHGMLLSSLPRGFPGAGRLIGLLERFLIFLFVLRGQYTAIAFLVTAKSVLRFGEIKPVPGEGGRTGGDSRKEPEYILIGTLLSVCWAISVGLVTLLVVSLVKAIW